MGTANKLLQAASGGAGDPVYAEDVFSTFLYTGTGATLAIDNGLDLDGEGGLVWLKGRGVAQHRLFDTARGANKYITSQDTDAQSTVSDQLMSFNSNGFTLGADSSTAINGSGSSLVSWSFRKQAGFFDVVTYTGDGTSNRTISHNLECKPGMILVKRTDSTANWQVWHRYSGYTYGVANLNSQSAWTNTGGDNAAFGSFTHSDTTFTTGAGSRLNDTNENGATYVAYLFAGTADSASQIFGENGDQGIIKCGSYSGNGSGTNGPTVTVGFEPQFIMLKAASRDGDWHAMDVNRGIVTDGRDYRLYWNDYAAELNNKEVLELSHSNGFRLNGTGDDQYNGSGETYIYVAIRRPMKPLDYGTEMFLPVSYTGNSTNNRDVDSTFNVDWAIFHQTNATDDGRTRVITRKTGGESGNDLRSLVNFSDTTAGAGIATVNWGHRQTGIELSDNTSVNYNGAAFMVHMFRRSPEVFDVINYRGDGSAGLAVAHNLGVKPELIIIRKLNSTGNWRVVWSLTASNSQNSQINGTDAGSTYAYDAGFRTISAEPTTTTFQVGNNVNVSDMNTNDSRYAAYLFATKAGVSKVAVVSHNNSSTTDVDCGFSSGARFVMLKRTDSTSDWRVFDSVTGIVAGNESFIRWNVDGANLTNDYVAPLSSGIQLTTYLDTGTYLILAIA